MTSPSSPNETVRRKTALRAEARARRAALSPAEREAAAQALIDQIPALDLPAPPSLVAGFWPIRDEIDVRPLMAALRAAGHRIALPVVGTGNLTFREWQDGERLVAAAFGTSEPGPEATECDPRLLLVPLLAFDREGRRLGYGKGHYDGAINRLSRLGPIRTVGVAFATQEVDEVPVEAHDRRLDAVLTEAGLQRFTPLSGDDDARSVPG